jgi:hypothetical protein
MKSLETEQRGDHGMTAAQIAHIFWKEYRTQRSIWLGIVLIAVVIQVLVWGMMPANARDPLATLASIGAILSVFYALASAGVLFAGEREEETYAWLRILPVSNLSLFGGKFLWFAVSWLLAVGISLVTAYLPYWGTELNREQIVRGLVQFASMGGGLALWGVFFSLLCQRVYTSLALAPLALLLTAGLNSYFPGVAYVFYAAVFIGTIIQGRRWIVEENLTIWTGFGWRSRALTLDEALGRAAEVSPAWRFFRRELWLEWRNARWIALGSFLILTVLMYFLVASGAPDAITIDWFLLFAVLPLLYGINTVRGEQHQSRYRFQSNVGASPAAVWTAKHLVWGGLLVLTMVASCFTVSLPWLDQALSRNRFRLADWLYEQLPVPRNAWPDFLYQCFSESWWPTVWLSAAMAVWMYAVGHVCSLLIKRSVSAALVAVAMGAVICVPVAATLLLDVPRSIGILLPALSLLLFGLWWTKGWLSERKETRDWLSVFGVLTVLGLVCTTSWVTWRLSELALPPAVAVAVSFFPVAGLELVGGLLIVLLLLALLVYRRKLTFNRVFLCWSAIHVLSGVAYVAAFEADIKLPSETELAGFVPSEEALETGKMYREVRLQISGDMPKIETDDELWEIFSGTLEATDEQWAWLDQNQAALEQLLKITERESCAPRDQSLRGRPGGADVLSLDWYRVVPLLRLRALKSEIEGNLEEAWSFHLAMLRMQRHMLMHRIPYWREQQVRMINDYYQRDLIRWINRPEQTSDLLVRAAKDFGKILAETSRMSDAIERQYREQIAALEQDRLGSWIQHDLEVTDWPDFLFQALHSLPWESRRGIHMLINVYEQQMSVAEAIETGNSRVYGPEIAAGTQLYGSYYPERAVWMWYEDSPESEEEAARWRLAETTPIFRGWGIEGFGTAPSQNPWMWQRELSWVRDRRLLFLQMALRVAELEDVPNTEVIMMNYLADARENPMVDQILTWSEELEGKRPRVEDSTEPRDRIGIYLLYRNPISGHLFQSDELQNLLR